jgi:hypothetical protein
MSSGWPQPGHLYSYDSSLSMTSLSFDVLFYARQSFYCLVGLSPWIAKTQGGSINYTVDGSSQGYPGKWENIYDAAGATSSDALGYNLGLGWRFGRSFALEFRLCGAFMAFWADEDLRGDYYYTPTGDVSWGQFSLSYRY